jgi:hypothetical protein
MAVEAIDGTRTCGLAALLIDGQTVDQGHHAGERLCPSPSFGRTLRAASSHCFDHVD